MNAIVKTAPATLTAIPDTLDDLAYNMRKTLKSADGARSSWVRAMTLSAVTAYKARQMLTNDMEFGKWWDAQEFMIAGKLMSHQDRAALVAIGASEEAAKIVFENTERRSLRMMVEKGELAQARAAVGLIEETAKRHSGRPQIAKPAKPAAAEKLTSKQAAELKAELRAQVEAEVRAEVEAEVKAQPEPEAQAIPEDVWETLRDALRPRQQEILALIEEAGEEGISKEALLETGHAWATSKHFDTNVAPLFMRGLIFALRPGHLVAAVNLPVSASTPVPAAPLTEEEYKLLRVCVHPDGGASKDRMTKAFTLLDERKALLVA